MGLTFGTHFFNFVPKGDSVGGKVCKLWWTEFQRAWLGWGSGEAWQIIIISKFG